MANLNLNPKGRDGVSLEAEWSEWFQTYQGPTVAGYEGFVSEANRAERAG